jgi:osomolarity two-component system response regulator SKN7
MMPKMDGISATRSIRQYDALTPIISMTSNFTDSDIMQYIGSGMTDILPKPFSKRTLYQMLEKYCAHLKTIQRVQGHDSTTTSIPRSLGDIELLPITVGESNSSSTPTNEAGPASSTSMYRPIEAPIPATSASSMPPVSTTSAPSSSAFPLAPYPYPVTMNSVSADANNASFTNATNGDIPNVTFWPQQQTQQHDPPPAIVPSSEGKFMWAVPGSNAQPTPFDPMGIINDANKRQRMNPPPPQEQ